MMPASMWSLSNCLQTPVLMQHNVCEMLHGTGWHAWLLIHGHTVKVNSSKLRAVAAQCQHLKYARYTLQSVKNTHLRLSRNSSSMSIFLLASQ
jgi:hypothetical protein